MKFIDLIPSIRDAKVNYRKDCSDENKVALSDIILQLELLAELVGSRNGIVDYLFIDEFQDTDDVQIRLVARFKEVFGLKLFVVGDTKQCIYRFRGADDAAFDLLETEIDSNITKIELKTAEVLLVSLNLFYELIN